MSDYDRDLYNGTPPHQSHSETSAESAKEIKESARSLRFKVYAYIKGRGAIGATDEEIQLDLGMQLQTEVPRRRELVMRGLVVDGGMKRLTRSDRQATAWVASMTFVEPEDRKRTVSEQLREANAEIGRLRKRVKDLESALWDGVT